jgi:hypothetical protein
MSPKKVTNLIKLMSLDMDGNTICDYATKLEVSNRNLDCRGISCNNCLLNTGRQHDIALAAKQEVIKILNEY